MKLKLNKRTVEAVQPGQKDVILWDSKLPGFGCKVTPRGRRSYFLYYRTKDHRERRPSIGVHGAITCEQARRIAEQWCSQVSEGGDPSAAKLEQRKSETLAEFAERYMTDYAPGKKKPSSIATDRINLHRHILPALGKLKVMAITRADVVRLLHSMKSTPGAANRTLALLSHMMNVAEKWGLRPDNTNPCRHVDKYPERKSRRFLSEAELAQLAQALADIEQTGTEMRSAIAAIRLLVFSGAEPVNDFETPTVSIY